MLPLHGTAFCFTHDNGSDSSRPCFSSAGRGLVLASQYVRDGGPLGDIVSQFDSG